MKNAGTGGKTRMEKQAFRMEGIAKTKGRLLTKTWKNIEKVWNLTKKQKKSIAQATFKNISWNWKPAVRNSNFHVFLQKVEFSGCPFWMAFEAYSKISVRKKLLESQRNSTAVRNAFGMILGSILMPFWGTFWMTFRSMRKVRFRWPFHAKTMFLGSKKHEKMRKMDSNFDLSSRHSFCKEIHQNLVQNGQNIDQNSIKNWFEKSMHFWTTQFSVPGTVQRQMLRQWGVGGDQFYSNSAVRLTRYAPMLKHGAADLRRWRVNRPASFVRVLVLPSGSGYGSGSASSVSQSVSPVSQSVS